MQCEKCRVAGIQFAGIMSGGSYVWRASGDCLGVAGSPELCPVVHTSGVHLGIALALLGRRNYVRWVHTSGVHLGIALGVAG